MSEPTPPVLRDPRLSHDLSMLETAPIYRSYPGSFAFRRDPVDAEAIAIAERVRATYLNWKSLPRAAAVDATPDMWTEIHTAPHREFLAIVERGDAAEIAAYLGHMAETPLVAGFMNYKPYQQLAGEQLYSYVEAMHVVDKIVSLGEAWRILSTLDPEQGLWLLSDIDFFAILSRAAQVDGKVIPAPRAGGGAYGLATTHGIFTMRDVIAMYTANRIGEVHDQYRCDARSVVEIGGGPGTLAYYGFTRGIRDYTIYDLPTVSLVQAYFLMRSLGQDAVAIFGEADADRRDAIKIRPHWTIRDNPVAAELFVNQDSFPEINKPEAMNYLAAMKNTGARYFLSINQEATTQNLAKLGTWQTKVWALAEEAGGFARLYRFRDWMRKGYVEELYAIGG
jgi:hypothetical protein